MLFCLFVCLSVRLYTINVKTAKLIGAKFFVGPLVTPWKEYGWSNFQKIASFKFYFWKFWKFTKFFIKYTKRTCSQWKWKMGAKRPNSLAYYVLLYIYLYFLLYQNVQIWLVYSLFLWLCWLLLEKFSFQANLSSQA